MESNKYQGHSQRWIFISFSLLTICTWCTEPVAFTQEGWGWGWRWRWRARLGGGRSENIHMKQGNYNTDWRLGTAEMLKTAMTTITAWPSTTTPGQLKPTAVLQKPEEHRHSHRRRHSNPSPLLQLSGTGSACCTLSRSRKSLTCCWVEPNTATFNLFFF